jgi:hypothetical protein
MTPNIPRSEEARPWRLAFLSFFEEELLLLPLEAVPLEREYPPGELPALDVPFHAEPPLLLVVVMPKPLKPFPLEEKFPPPPPPPLRGPLNKERFLRAKTGRPGEVGGLLE